MKAARKIAIFTDRYPLIGPIVWTLSVQYFVAQIVVASAWSPAYSWASNLISDLGNSLCTPYLGRMVCSPEYEVMNLSFISLGTTMALGSLLIYQEFRESKWSLIGFSLMALAGLGTMLVGFFPENTISWLHLLGAFLALGVGNLSLIILALALYRVRRSFRIYTIITGVVSLLAFTLLAFGIYLGVGPGTIERIASYPQTIWLTLFGIYMTSSHLRSRQQSHQYD